MGQQKKEYYVDNKLFYTKLVERREKVKQAKLERKNELPRISEYIGKCIWLIANRLNNSYNFISYSYRDEMISDGIEDCILRVDSFDPDQASFRFYREVQDPETGVWKDTMVWQKSDKKFLQEYIETEFPKSTFKLAEFEKEIYGKYTCDTDYGDFRIKISRNPFAYFTQICYFASVRRIKKEKKQTAVKAGLVKNSGVINDMMNERQVGDDTAYANSYLTFLLENVDNNTMTDAEKEQSQKNKKTTKQHQMRLKDRKAAAALAALLPEPEPTPDEPWVEMDENDREYNLDNISWNEE